MYNNCAVLFADERADDLTELLKDLNFQMTAFGHCVTPCANPARSVTIPDYEIIYIVSGRIAFAVDGTEYECLPGGTILLEPFMTYSARRLTDEIDHYYIHFEAGPAYRLPDFKELVTGSQGPVFSPKELPQLNLMFSMLENDIQEKTSGYQTLLSVSFLRMVIYMCRARQRHRQITERMLTPRETQIVSDSMVYIENNLSSPLKITDISSHLGISENYLYKSFMSVMKISPSRYLLQYKVKRAEKLLRTGNYTVEQISKMLGFSSLFHFSKTFKDFFGASPKQYLKNQAFQ